MEERKRRNGRVTIRDVAKEAGVSQSTVSHFLNRTAPLLPETKQRIREAIKKLNYRPHLVARNFKRRRTASLGLFVPDMTNLFYAELSRGVADAAQERGYSVILYSTSYQKEMERNFVGLVEQGQVDGVIVAYSLIEDSLWNRLFGCGIPLVLVDIYPFVSRVAIGAMKALLSAGIRIPEDISVVGFDDILLASYFHPSLTTVRQPKYEMGRIGVELLLKLVEGEGSFENVLLAPSLVERNSCRKLK
jgi:DNA-binding LacI/PurR family transcriptional regulator